MKNLFKFSTIIIAAGILFSSCESNLSIIKRHYNSGYYIDYTKNNKGITPKTDVKIAKASAINPVSMAQSPVEQNVVVKNSVQNTKQGISAILANVKRIMPKVNLQPHAKQNQVSRIGIVGNTSLENNKTVLDSPTMNASVSDDGNRGQRALSLLWLVIVIILILWLIGLLAGGWGLGGFINLLLVIAVILLILWLLRII
ncbi:MAG: DUF5670 family protein [Bacteroidia bacterium]